MRRTSSWTDSDLLVRASCTPTVRAVFANMELSMCFRECDDSSPLLCLEDTTAVNPEQGAIRALQQYSIEDDSGCKRELSGWLQSYPEGGGDTLIRYVLLLALGALGIHSLFMTAEPFLSLLYTHALHNIEKDCGDPLAAGAWNSTSTREPLFPFRAWQSLW